MEKCSVCGKETEALYIVNLGDSDKVYKVCKECIRKLEEEALKK